MNTFLNRKVTQLKKSTRKIKSKKKKNLTLSNQLAMETLVQKLNFIPILYRQKFVSKNCCKKKFVSKSNKKINHKYQLDTNTQMIIRC